MLPLRSNLFLWLHTNALNIYILPRKGLTRTFTRYLSFPVLFIVRGQCKLFCCTDLVEYGTRLLCCWIYCLWRYPDSGDPCLVVVAISTVLPTTHPLLRPSCAFVLSLLRSQFNVPLYTSSSAIPSFHGLDKFDRLPGDTTLTTRAMVPAKSNYTGPEHLQQKQWSTRSYRKCIRGRVVDGWPEEALMSQ